MKNAAMPHPGHDKHLCYLRNLHYPTVNPEEYKALVRKGKYLCKNCGRVAAEAANLCKPEVL